MTGASGRLGRALLAAAAQRGLEVVAIDLTGAGPEAAARDAAGREPAQHEPAAWRQIEADVRDYDALVVAMAGCDAVVHLAAHVSPGAGPPQVVHNDNVTGSYNVLSACVQLRIRRACLASSVNAIGGPFSALPRYDWFPLDESHPTYNEDPYSLSKWALEMQADSTARRHPEMTITSLRIHRLVPDRASALQAVAEWPDQTRRDLWGYTTLASCAEACLLALEASFSGHEACFVVSPQTAHPEDSATLAARYYPQTELRRPLEGHDGFYDCAKAARLLGWRHRD